jgi:uncharacterized cupredoxin-like copper-binding protein
MKPLFILSALALLALLARTTASYAHVDQTHKANTSIIAVVKEQKDWGIAGDKASRTIRVSMSDKMRFSPNKISVKQGETVKLEIRNTGNMLHEFVIGNKKELDEHAELMVKFPNMEHDEPYMAHVPPHQTRNIIWTFNTAGEFDFACLIAGHYQAGMTGKIIVKP